MISFFSIVLHYFEPTKLQMEHKVLYQLLQMLLLLYQQITNFSDQVKMKLVSQLIKGISRVLQKLLKYFNCTILSTSFLPLAAVLPVIFCLNLNEALLSAA